CRVSVTCRHQIHVSISITTQHPIIEPGHPHANHTTSTYSWDIIIITIINHSTHSQLICHIITIINHSTHQPANLPHQPLIVHIPQPQ
ncbi:MAG UNVERIFIED_CONTAM: hypothetical protein LVR18_25195, partial [Planctomycetaceae bacterium]